MMPKMFLNARNLPIVIEYIANQVKTLKMNKVVFICEILILFALESCNSNCKEVQIVYRLFLVNCYQLHLPRHPSQPASNVGG